MWINFREHYHDRSFQINVQNFLSYGFNVSNMHTTTVNGEVYKWCHISGGGNHLEFVGDDPGQIQRAVGPSVQFFPADTEDPTMDYRNYCRMDMGDNGAGYYFRFAPNGTAIRDFRIAGVQICDYDTYGSATADRILFTKCIVNAEDGVLVTNYESGDNYFYSGVWFSQNCFTEGRLRPYDTEQPQTTPGDPNQSGGIGGGLPTPSSTGASDNHNALLSPFGDFMRAWNVSGTELSELGSFFWGNIGNAFSIGGMWERWTNYKYNPAAALIGCHKIPDQLQISLGPSVNVRMAGFEFNGSTGVGGVTITGKAIASGRQVSILTASTPQLTRAYGSFRDFARTRVMLYVPYCGVMNLDPSCCIGGYIYLTIQCDNLNGNVAAQVATTNFYGQTQVVGCLTGNCAYRIPLTGSDNGVGGFLGSIGGIGSSVAGAASAAYAYNPVGVATNAAKAIGNTLKAAMGPRWNTVVNGDCTGNAGWLTHQTAFVQITYGEYLDTTDYYNDVVGRPSNCYGPVSSFSGFSQLVVHANEISYATEAEKKEIEDICYSGIIV